MKINMPLTNKEVLMTKGSILVTRTDLKGKITYANDDFLKISGYTRDEVIGQSHNMIRHPDMPAELFEDLWENIKAMRPWVGVIKNRAKNGDHYWVHANVVPQFKQGKVTEYLSVRYAPKKGEVEEAETFYKLLKDKKVNFKPRGIKKFLNKIREMSIWYKTSISLLAFSVPAFAFSYQLFLSGQYILLASVMSAGLVGALINIGIIYEFNTTIDKTVGILYRLSAKGFGNKFDLKRTGVIGDFFRGLFSMDVNLSLDMAETKRITTEALRINSALDNVHSSIMVANTQFEIIYVNNSASALFKNAENAIRKEIPDFDANKLLGSNIDIFHQEPSMQRKLLENLKNSYESTLNIAGHNMMVFVNPVLDKNGERIGFVSEWFDKTDEIQAMQEISDIVTYASQGDFSQKINEQHKNGFVLELSKSVNSLLENSAAGLGDIVRVLNALSHGDLTQKVTNNYAGTFGQLKNDANKTVDKLTEVIDQIKSATDSINVGSREIAAGNNDLSNRTEKQAASLEETSTRMQELTSMVQKNSQNAEHANDLAIGASDIAAVGVNVIDKVVAEMEGINESSNRIVDIISVIDSIAFQTNILALNAAVEAARAGEQGRGFAVVATEVRNLAQRASAAAGEIRNLIGDSVEKVENGTQLVTHAGKTMREIVNAIENVTSIMSEISKASISQNTGIQQVNQAISHMDDMTQQNAALVEEAASSAESLEEQVKNLATMVKYFNI